MKLNDPDKNLLYPLIHSHISKLEGVVAEWDALPADTMVNNLDRHAVARAKEDLPKYRELLNRLVNGEPKVAPTPNDKLNEDQVEAMREIMNHLNEAKYHLDRADSSAVCDDHPAEVFSDQIMELHGAVERVESDLLEAFPQSDPEYVADCPGKDGFGCRCGDCYVETSPQADDDYEAPGPKAPNDPAVTIITEADAVATFGQELVCKMKNGLGTTDDYWFLVLDDEQNIVNDPRPTHLLLFSQNKSMGYVGLEIGGASEWETFTSNPSDEAQYGAAWNDAYWGVCEKVKFILQRWQD